MSNYIKKYEVGNIAIDLPYNSHIHELLLLSFSDFRNSVNISLIFNQKLKYEQNNMFNIQEGFKLNIQKRIIVENGVPTKLINENGKYDLLNMNYQDLEQNYRNYVFTFNDDSRRVVRMKVEIDPDTENPISYYELEYPDFSKEIYNSNGYLLKSYDKYGDEYLSYTYNGNLLTRVEYNGKKVNFQYSNNKLASISYDIDDNVSYVTTLQYNNNITINHYSGVKYYIIISQNEYMVRSEAVENSKYITFIKTCKYLNNTITLSSKYNNKVIDTVVYTYPESVENVCKLFDQIEVMNKKGVKQRIQYQYEKPLYSYELDYDYDDVLFEGVKSVTEVNIYDTLDGQTLGGFKGLLKINDGCQMNQDPTDNKKYNLYVPALKEENTDGQYMITGWIKSNDISKVAELCASPSYYVGLEDYLFYVPINEVNKWYFFAYKIQTDEAYVYLRTDTQNVELKDVRITYLKTHFIDENAAKHSLLKEEIIINPENDEKFPLSDAIFFYETEGGDIGNIQLTFSDLLRYKQNKMRRYWHEVTYENAKKVVSEVLWLKVKNNKIQNSEYINVLNVYLGYKSYKGEKEIITKIIDNFNESIFKISNTVSTETSEYSYSKLNSNFDLLESKAQDITKTYERDKGLITREKIKGEVDISDIFYNYSNNTCTVRNLKENNYLFDGITYYIDPIWGTPYKIEYSDGTTTIDTFDDDKLTILSKSFQKSTNNITHNFGYNEGNLTSLSCEELNYTFEYDYNELEKIEKLGSTIEELYHDNYSSIAYYPNENSAVYSKVYNYDRYNRLESITGELENTYGIYSSFDDNGELYYDFDSSLSKLLISVDQIKNLKSRYNYNNQGLLIRKEVTHSTDYSNKVSDEFFEYDDINRLTSKIFMYHPQLYKLVKDKITYCKGSNDLFVDERIANSEFYIIQDINNNDDDENNEINEEDFKIVTTTNMYYDVYNNLKEKTHVFSKNLGTKTYKKEYHYDNNYRKVTDELTHISDYMSKSIEYTYDNFDRIASIKMNNKTSSYQYDDFGRLIRENNEALDKTIVYEYNNIGNITSKKVYDYTTAATPSTLLSNVSYTYDTTQKDRLINFNGTNISYNTLGCPTLYKGYNVTWNKGKLVGLSKGTLQTGTESYSYSYNAYGQRVSKHYSKLPPINGIIQMQPDVVTSYDKQYSYDHSGRLINEVTSYERYNGSTYSETIEYIYDVNTIIGMKYTTGTVINTYYFDRNILGDVVAIYDLSGNLKVKYSYDAYGNCTISNETTDQVLANVNPIRYRGYYYDVETGLFYCNSRYYNPEWCRWISPDDIKYLDPESVNGLNLYCYCMNNPIMYVDPSGHFPILGLIIGTIIEVVNSAMAGISLVIGGTISAINRIATSPILNALIVQGITDAITLGTTVGATYIGYLTGKLVVKGIKAIGKWFKKFWKRINTPGGGSSLDGSFSYWDPGTLTQASQNIMTSFGGTFKKQFDDGDDS